MSKMYGGIYKDKDFSVRKEFFIYKNNKYKVTTTKSKENWNEFVFDAYDYFIYSKERPVAKAQIAVIKDCQDFCDTLVKLGFSNVPSTFFWLTKIGVIEIEQRGNGFGSVLLNYVLGDICQYNSSSDQKLSVLFDRLNSDQTRKFYNNFGATENVRHFRYTAHTPMIIQNPKTIEKYNVEFLDGSFASTHQK